MSSVSVYFAGRVVRSTMTQTQAKTLEVPVNECRRMEVPFNDMALTEVCGCTEDACNTEFNGVKTATEISLLVLAISLLSSVFAY